MALIGPGPGTRDLRDFLKLLEERGQLRRITAPVDPDLELAAIADRVLAAGGPALLFENVIGSSMPVAVNTLGTVERVVWSMGLERAEQLEELGSRLAILSIGGTRRGPTGAASCSEASKPTGEDPSLVQAQARMMRLSSFRSSSPAVKEKC